MNSACVNIYPSIMDKITVTSSNSLRSLSASLLVMKKPTEDQLPRESLARNLSHLKELCGYTERDIAAKAGVAPKTVNNMLNGNHDSSLDKVNAVAKVFGLQGWHLIMPNLPLDLISSPTISKFVGNFISASDEGRNLLQQMAEREAKIAKNGK